MEGGQAVGRRQHSQSTGLGGALAVALGIGAALAASTAIAQADTPDAGQPSTPGAAAARATDVGARSAGPRRNPVKAVVAETSGRTPSFSAPDRRSTIPAGLADAKPGEAVLPTIPAVVSAAAPKPAVTAYGATIAPPSAAPASIQGIFGTAPPVKPAQLPLAMTPMLSWLGRDVEVAGAARAISISKVAVAKTVTVTTAAVTTPTATTPTVTTPTATTLTAATIPTAATTPTVITVEAETLTVSPAKSGSRFSDRTASGGAALLLSKNAIASQTLTLPAFTSLVIRARGDQYKGAPAMQVSVDGKVVSTIAVSATGWTDYTIPVSGLAGTHTVSIAFTNDLRVSASKDRNLRIDKITVVAGAVTPPSTQTPAYFGTADWLWKPIAANPTLASNSATWVSYLSAPGAKRIANLYNYGVTLVPASAITTSTPRYDVRFTKAWGADPYGTNTVAIPRGTKIPPGSDGHIAVLDPVSGQAYGIWQARYDSATDTWSGSWGGRTPINGNGIDQTGSATAAGISRAAGVVTAAELQAAIAANTGLNHALVFSTDIAGPGFVGPAIKSDGTNIAGVATPMPEGYRIQLDPTINVDAIPNITAGEKVIAKTLQTHGAYVVDQGAARMAFAFETVPDATSTNPGAVYTKAGFAWDYYDMARIPWSQLRVLAA